MTPTYIHIRMWNIDSHAFMFTEKPAYQDPLEALPPSCLLGSAECHSALNADLGIQPRVLPLWSSVKMLRLRGESPRDHSFCLECCRLFLGVKKSPAKLHQSITVVPNLTVWIYPGTCIVRQFNITSCDTVRCQALRWLQCHQVV